MKLAVLPIAICAVLAGSGCGGSGDSSDGSTEYSITQAEKAETRSVKSKPAAKKAEPSGLVPRKAEPHIVLPKVPPPKKKVIVKDLEKGTGAVAKTGDLLTVDVLGVYYKDGKPVTPAWDESEPFTFELGGGKGNLGWENSLQGMRVGGRRELIIPRHLTSRYLIPSMERSQIYVLDLRKIGPLSEPPR